MFAHPVFRTLLSQPDLLLEHAGAYAQLAGAEMGEAGQRLKWRGLLGAGAVLALLFSLLLGSAALLAVCVVPLEQMPWPWGLVLVPALPALVGLACLFAYRRTARALDFPLLREQWATDRQILATAREL